jgi:hypothetical protein
MHHRDRRAGGRFQISVPRSNPDRSEEPIPVPRSDAEQGRFRISVPRSDRPPRKRAFAVRREPQRPRSSRGVTPGNRELNIVGLARFAGNHNGRNRAAESLRGTANRTSSAWRGSPGTSNGRNRAAESLRGTANRTSSAWRGSPGTTTAAIEPRSHSGEPRIEHGRSGTVRRELQGSRGPEPAHDAPSATSTRTSSSRDPADSPRDPLGRGANGAGADGRGYQRAHAHGNVVVVFTGQLEPTRSTCPCPGRA